MATSNSTTMSHSRSLETWSRLLGLLRSGTARRGRFLRYSAVLGTVLVLVFRYAVARRSRGATVPNLITEPGRVGRRVKRSEEEYDPEEYDVVIVGGGERWDALTLEKI